MCGSEVVKSLRNVHFVFILDAAVGFSKAGGYGSRCSAFFRAILGMEVKLVRCFIPSAVYSRANPPAPTRLCSICSAVDVQNALARVECSTHRHTHKPALNGLFAVG